MKSRFLRALSFGILPVLAGATLVVTPLLQHSIHAQRPDLLAAAARYPRFTKAQRMSILREHQFQAHPTWKNLSFSEAAQRLVRFATRLVAPTPPNAANFLGNTTAINSPSGSALALARQSNCSLTLMSGTYQLSLTSPGYTITNTTANYEQVLHSAANLTTTPDQFLGGCADAPQGLSVRRAVYVGKTPGGSNVFGAYVYNSVAGETDVYSVITDSAYAYKSSTSLPTGALTTGLVTADFNKDGIGDLASLNNPLSLADSATLSLFQGNADGSFQAPTDIVLPGNDAISAVVDDFNNDGVQDLVVVTQNLSSVGNSISYELSFLAGKGDGTFKPAQSVTATPVSGITTPYAGITSASVRGNGNKDLITPEGLILFGNGDGTFVQPTALAFANLPATSEFGPNVAVADFNKDGKVDLAVGNGESISIFNGNGDGTFNDGLAYASINDVGYLTATDVDGDGNLDLYVGFANGGIFGGDQFEFNQSYALMGNGDGSFQGAPVTPFAFTGTNVADLNNDGKLDGVGLDEIVTSGDVSFTSYLGKGNGTFASKSTVTVSPIMIQGTSFSVTSIDSFGLGDFNGDGNADLLYFPKQFSGPAGQTGYFFAAGDGSGGFQSPVYYPAPSFVPAGDTDYTEQLSNVLVADVNHDGKPDILYNYSDQGYTSQTYYQGIAVQLGNGDGTFKAPQTIQTYSSKTIPSVTPPLVIQTGDANQDGKTDIFVLLTSVVSSGIATQLELYLGNGDGTFGAPSNPPVADQINTPTFGSQLGQVVLADMNSDGHLDLVTLGTTVDGKLAELAVSLGKGDGTFATPSVLNFGGGSSLGYGLAVADFDGDGKPDVFVGGFNPPYDSGIFPGNGDGTFQSFPNSYGFLQPAEAIQLLSWGPAMVADFNADGKVDVLGGDTMLLNRGVTTSGGGPTGTVATTTALVASATSVAPGTGITFTATISVSSGTAAATGTVTFYDGTTDLGSAVLGGGAANYNTSSLALRTHSITASYGGDSNYAASTSNAVTVTVTTTPAAATTTTLTVTPTTAAAGTAVQFLAKVAGGATAPTGTVTFLDGTTTVGTGTLASGGASFSTTSLAVGAHSITASYSGDASNAASVSAPVSVTITAAAAGFSVSLAPASGSVASAGSTTTALTVTPSNGFNQAVSFACGALPAATTCAFSPATVTPSGAAVVTTMTITTGVSPSIVRTATNGNHTWPLALAGGVLGLAFLRRGRRFRSAVLSCLAILACGVLVLGMGSCSAGSSGSSSGSGNSTGTAAGISSVSITATSGSLTQTATYTLTVQ